MSTRFGKATDAGTSRALNEDAVFAAPPIFAVADGMGGHAAGEVASALALAQLVPLTGRTDLQPDDVLAVIAKANQAILGWSNAGTDTAGMGTTVSGVCLGDVGGVPHWMIFNVGDSRVYRYSEGGLTQITIDHSEVAELVQAGRITSKEARTHPRRNVVTRSLGTDPSPIPDLWVVPAVEGDVFLVCSDGLTLELDDNEIAAALLAAFAAESSPQLVADDLVSRAVAAGGRDNVSAVVVEVPMSDTSIAVDISTVPRSKFMGSVS